MCLVADPPLCPVCVQPALPPSSPTRCRTRGTPSCSPPCARGCRYEQPVPNRRQDAFFFLALPSRLVPLLSYHMVSGVCVVVVPQCLIKSVVESEEAKDVEALGSLSKKFLPTLLSLLDACPPEDPASAPKIVSSISDMARSSNWAE